MDERRKLWKEHNNLKRTRIPVYAYIGLSDALEIEIISKALKCQDPLLRYIESQMRCSIFKDSVGDDDVIEPYVHVLPSFKKTGWCSRN